MTHRWKFVLVAAVIAPGVMACESSTSGSPTSVSAAPVQLFDPCTQIPDDVLRSAGVDPATEESGIAGVHQSGWEICTWKGSKYTLSVLSTDKKVDEFERKPGNVGFQDVTITGRQGRQFRVQGGSYDLMCDMVFPASQGVIELTLINSPILDNPSPPCGLLSQVGQAVVPVLPK